MAEHSSITQQLQLRSQQPVPAGYIGPVPDDRADFTYFDLDAETGEPSDVNEKPTSSSCWGCEYGIKKPVRINENPIAEMIWKEWTRFEGSPLSFRFQKVAEAHDYYVIQKGAKLGRKHNMEPWSIEDIERHFMVCLTLPEIRTQIALKRIQALERKICQAIVKRNDVTNELLVNPKDVDSFHKIVKLEQDLMRLTQKNTI